MARKIAIVAVHGVIPQQRYGFQDQVATALRDRLNGFPGNGAPPSTNERAGAGAHGHSEFRGDETGNVAPSPWRMDVVFPDVSPDPAALIDPVGAERPSIIRVHQNEADALHPAGDAYDVIEAYWSPIDKGKTNFAKVMAWFLSTIFQPVNTTARYRGWPIKALSDVSYVLFWFVLFGLIILAACFIIAAQALDAVASIAAGKSPLTAAPNWYDPLRAFFENILPTHWWGPLWAWFGSSSAAFGQAMAVLMKPDTLMTILGFHAILRLAIGVVGAYLLAQGVRASISFFKQHHILKLLAAQQRARVAFTAGLYFIGAVLILICACWPLPPIENAPPLKSVPYPGQLGSVAIMLIFTAAGVELFKTLVTAFITNFFGDVEIYCTHDENNEFFVLRAEILDLVERTIVSALKGDYDRVYVFAHSLGATISLDALLRLYNLQAEKGLAPAEWQRLRGFVTFGSALEKTRFFTDAYGQSLSASLEEWNNDYYGALFTPDDSVLTHPNGTGVGIYWANYWYFLDFISDRIASYRSFLKPGDAMSASTGLRVRIRGGLKKSQIAVPNIVAQNRVSYRLPSTPWQVLHGDYLSSNWFWCGNTEGPGTATAWWAKPWLGFRGGELNDRAIDVLEIVKSATAAVPTPPNPQLVPRFTAQPASSKASQNLIDVLPPAAAAAESEIPLPAR